MSPSISFSICRSSVSVTDHVELIQCQLKHELRLNPQCPRFEPQFVHLTQIGDSKTLV